MLFILIEPTNKVSTVSTQNNIHNDVSTPTHVHFGHESGTCYVLPVMVYPGTRSITIIRGPMGCLEDRETTSSLTNTWWLLLASPLGRQASFCNDPSPARCLFRVPSDVLNFGSFFMLYVYVTLPFVFMIHKNPHAKNYNCRGNNNCKTMYAP